MDDLLYETGGVATVSVDIIQQCWDEAPDALTWHLFDLLVGGEFQEEGANLMQNQGALQTLLDALLFPGDEDAEQSAAWIQRIVEITASSLMNQAFCSSCGVLETIINAIPNIQHNCVLHAAIQLMELVGSFSATVKEIKMLCMLMQPSPRNERRYHTPYILQSLFNMLSSEKACGFIHLTGIDSGLALPSVNRWPSRNGFSTSLWFRVESHALSQDNEIEKDEHVLFVFQCTDGRGIECLVRQHKLCIVLYHHHGKSEEYTIDVPIQTGHWYNLVLSQSASGFFTKSEMKIYLDGVCHLTKFVYAYSLGGLHVTRCLLGWDGRHGSRNSLKGQIASFYLFDVAISPDVPDIVFWLGPSYMGTFCPTEVSTESSARTQKVFQQGWSKHLVIAISPYCMVDDVFLSLVPSDSVGIQYCKQEMHAKPQPGTRRYITRDVQSALSALGGFQALFPILSQLDLDVEDSTCESGSCPPEIIPILLRMMSQLLWNDVALQKFAQSCKLFGIIARRLAVVSPQHLNVHVVSAMKDVVSSLIHHEKLYIESFSAFFLNFSSWVYTSPETQHAWIDSAQDIIMSKPAFWNAHIGIEPFIDGIANVFWYSQPFDGAEAVFEEVLSPHQQHVAGMRPSKEKLSFLRKRLFDTIEFLCLECVTLGDISIFVGVTCSSVQIRHLQDVMATFLNIFKQQPKDVSAHLRKLGGEFLFINLSRFADEDLTLLGLEGLCLYMEHFEYALTTSRTNKLFSALWRWLSTHSFSDEMYLLLLRLLVGHPITRNELTENSNIRICHPFIYDTVLKLGLRADVSLRKAVMEDMEALFHARDNRTRFIPLFDWQRHFMDYLLLCNPKVFSSAHDTPESSVADRMLSLYCQLAWTHMSHQGNGWFCVRDSLIYLGLVSNENADVHVLVGAFRIFARLVEMQSNEKLQLNWKSRTLVKNVCSLQRFVERLVYSRCKSVSYSYERISDESHSIEIPREASHNADLATVIPLLTDLFSLNAIMWKSEPSSVSPKSSMIRSKKQTSQLIPSWDMFLSLWTKVFLASNSFTLQFIMMLSTQGSCFERMFDIVCSGGCIQASIDSIILDAGVETSRFPARLRSKQSKSTIMDKFCSLLYHSLGYFFSQCNTTTASSFLNMGHQTKILLAQLIEMLHRILTTFEPCLHFLYRGGSFDQSEEVYVLLLDLAKHEPPSIPASADSEHESWIWYYRWVVELCSPHWRIFQEETLCYLDTTASASLEEDLMSDMNKISVEIRAYQTTTKENAAREQAEHANFQDKPAEILQAHVTHELNRKESVLIRARKQQETVDQNWNIIFGKQTSERGMWHVPQENLQQLYTLDLRETSQRMHLKLLRGSVRDNHAEKGELVDFLQHDSDAPNQPGQLREASPTRDLRNKVRILPGVRLLRNLGMASSIHLTLEELEEDEDKNDTAKDSKKEELLYRVECEMVSLLEAPPGVLDITNVAIYFTRYEQNNVFEGRDPMSFDRDIAQVWQNQGIGVHDQKWCISELREIHLRRFQLQWSALELFFADQTTVLLHFFLEKKRNTVYRKLLKAKPSRLTFKQTTTPQETVRQSDMTQRWVKHDISNFEYLMYLNTVSGRTFNDLTQYPVFPWIITDYTSPSLDLLDVSIYRDLSKPVGALNPERLADFERRYRDFVDPDIPRFYYGTHYSNSGSVLYYLLRLEPFTSCALHLQDGRFDRADRLFHSLPETWRGCYTNNADVKELIPEFFFLPEILKNVNQYNFGTRQSGNNIGEVALPPWASSPEEFIRLHREALESDVVSSQMHHWIDLIWGYKQTGKDAEEAFNLFFHLTYEGAVDVSAIEDPVLRAATVAQINEFGQTPSQLFSEPHPHRHTAVHARVTLFSDITNIQRYTDELVAPPGVPLLLITVSNGQLITLSVERSLQLHTWRPFVPESEPPFALYLDAKARSPIASYLEPTLCPSNSIAAVSAGHLLLAGLWDNSFRVVHCESGRPVQTCARHTDTVTCIASDGRFVASGSRDTTVMVWDVSPDGTVLDVPRHTLCGHDDAVSALALHADADIVVSCSADKTCNVHSIQTGEYIRSISLSQPAHLCALSSLGSIILATPTTLALYSINGALVATAPVEQRVTCAVFAADCAFVLVGDVGGAIRVYDGALRVVLTMERCGAPITCICIPDEEQFLFVGLADGRMVLFALDANQLRRRMLAKLNILGF